jgi:hypothetical protein
MPLYLARPSKQHKASNVLSSTSSSGLTVQEPEPSQNNLGALRLRCSGVPLGAASIDVRLQTGGAPYGYAPDVATTETSGVSALWRDTGDSGTQWRGHVDTSALVRVAHPVAWDATHGKPSQPKVLPDGSMGFIMATIPGTETVKFYRVSADWSSTNSTIVSGIAASSVRHDFAVLPSGRLVAVLDLYYVYYSDDYGATWTALTTASNLLIASMDTTCMEAVGDQLVLIAASATAAAPSWVCHSRDGGATWTVAEAGVSLYNPTTCVRDGVVHVATKSGVSLYAYRLLPGGGLSAPTATEAGMNVTTLASGAIVARDDGVLWAFGWQASAAGTLDLDAGVSTDGGLTWADSGGDPFTLTKTAYAADGLRIVGGTAWNGSVVLIANADSASGSDGGLHFLCFGEWSTFAEYAHGLTTVSGVPYRRGYVPVDYPHNVGWTRYTTGAGGTITNQPFLRVVTTAGNGERWVAPTAIWPNTAAQHLLIKARVRVNSGGSLTASEVYLSASVDDGANQQKITMRLRTTGARVVDSTGAQLGSDLTATLTNWTDFILDFWHDNPAGAGKLSIYYMQDGGRGYYVPWLENVTINEQAGVAAGALQWEVSEAASADLGMLMARNVGLVTYRVNPADLVGRPLSAAFDYQVDSGLRLGAYGSGGIPADTYTMQTRYTYGPENVWRDLRPSSRTESAVDGVNWSIVFDAGANTLFAGDLVAVFGTNMRTATWQMNSSNSWGAPAVSVSLNATIISFTVGSGVRGAGYLGPAAAPNWTPGMWRSNGDSRRMFLDLGGTIHEITDNDESRIYVDGVDFSAATGTAYVFGDRMASTLTFAQYRYARLSVGAVNTADGAFRVGTPIFASKWTPSQLYDYGFVDRVTPNITTTEADSGSSISYRRGPALDSLAIQWPPVDRLRVDAEERLRHFYRSIDGSLTPVVMWRDSTDIRTLALVQVQEVYSASNVYGELGNAVTRVDQLVLREVW